MADVAVCPFFLGHSRENLARASLSRDAYQLFVQSESCVDE